MVEISGTASLILLDLSTIIVFLGFQLDLGIYWVGTWCSRDKWQQTHFAIELFNIPTDGEVLKIGILLNCNFNEFQYFTAPHTQSGLSFRPTNHDRTLLEIHVKTPCLHMQIQVSGPWRRLTRAAESLAQGYFWGVAAQHRVAVDQSQRFGFSPSFLTIFTSMKS